MSMTTDDSALVEDEEIMRSLEKCSVGWRGEGDNEEVGGQDVEVLLDCTH